MRAVTPGPSAQVRELEKELARAQEENTAKEQRAEAARQKRAAAAEAAGREPGKRGRPRSEASSHALWFGRRFCLYAAFFGKSSSGALGELQFEGLAKKSRL